MFEFQLPSLGADMDQGKLLVWHVQPGDTVHKGQVVAVVDTSKAAVDVEIWQQGTVWQLLVQPGETVPVGTPLATLLAPGEQPPAGGAPAPKPVAVPPQPAMPEAPAQAAPVRVAAVAAAAVATPPPPPGRRPASPAARQRAQALGLELSHLTGSGAGGAITLADVERAAAQAANQVAGQAGAPAQPAAAVAAAKSSAASRQAEMRRTIGEAMARSKREIPHYYLLETIPMARAQQWLLQTNATRPITDRLLMAVLQLKAVALALQQFPAMNGFYRDGAFQPVRSSHIGVAISLRQGGLIAPALHDVAQQPLDQLMRNLSDLVRRARAGSLRSSELSDASITVTNLGDQGVEAVLGVIYPPQVALLGFGRMALRPWVQDDGQLCALPTVTASLAADHRVSDGHDGALFLAAVRDALQRPQDL
ncbi:MAG: 2-oxo acid dehydrogenase subunit E2 [Burkholderiaceae bacterium]|nr:2-oxo acid dehydrogenase subunit E2 [Burkholderiaceae bacterium]